MNSKYMHACQDLLFGDDQSLHALDKMVDMALECLYIIVRGDSPEGLSQRLRQLKMYAYASGFVVTERGPLT